MSVQLSAYCEMTFHDACRGMLAARSILPCECDCHAPAPEEKQVVHVLEDEPHCNENCHGESHYLMPEGDHWLVMDEKRWITGCQCGFKATDEFGYGDSVVIHLLATAWAEGHSHSQVDVNNPYNLPGVNGGLGVDLSSTPSGTDDVPNKPKGAVPPNAAPAPGISLSSGDGGAGE